MSMPVPVDGAAGGSRLGGEVDASLSCARQVRRYPMHVSGSAGSGTGSRAVGAVAHGTTIHGALAPRRSSRCASTPSSAQPLKPAPAQTTPPPARSFARRSAGSSTSPETTRRSSKLCCAQRNHGSVEVHGNADGGVEPCEHRCARPGRPRSSRRRIPGRGRSNERCRRRPRGRQKGGRGVKRASSAGHSRSLAVTGGHPKTYPGQGR